MKYHHIEQAKFLSRPNRFIAYVELNGERTKVHVKNTGRCGELLRENAAVYLEKSENQERTTAYDLVAVEKAGRLVNIDSNAPNKVVEEWLARKQLFPDLTLVRPETIYRNSRFDFYLETASGRKIFMEVKGVTLENDNQAAFPDAPSERAVKHVEELMLAKQEGYEAYILFVIQMKEMRSFSPNEEAQPAFGEALRRARRAGVKVLAYDCEVGPDSLMLRKEVPVVLSSLDRIAEPLLAWYDRGRRILPWRESPTPYHVWISEIMLQQTRVEAVKPYYDRFMKALPDIAHLAQAKDEELLKLWEGLGYYNRVRNMKKAARMIMEEYGGVMPEEYEDLLRLPGIGSYTAGAVSSIACGRRAPAVDGNVLRVLSRILASREDIGKASVKKRAEEMLRRIMPAGEAGAFNQGLMELGETVCVPNGSPKCEECPVKKECLARELGLTGELPVKAPPKKRRIEKRTVCIMEQEDQVALCRREDTGLLASLYELPNVEGHWSLEQLSRVFHFREDQVISAEQLPDAKHVFSHVEWHMIGYRIKVGKGLPKGLIAAKKEELKTIYPLPNAFSRYTKLIK